MNLICVIRVLANVVVPAGNLRPLLSRIKPVGSIPAGSIPEGDFICRANGYIFQLVCYLLVLNLMACILFVYQEE